MRFDPEIHHRRSIRLRGYDYAVEGAYFITICTFQRESLLGQVTGGEMMLNESGRAVQEVWEGLPAHFSQVFLDAFVIMPNHLHGIIVLNGPAEPGVGAGLRPAQDSTAHGSAVGRSETCPYGSGGGETRVPVAEIVRALKSFSARRINQIRDNPGVPVWQRNYYERVIRDEAEMERARRYILENPIKWETDRENPLHSQGGRGGS